MRPIEELLESFIFYYSEDEEYLKYTEPVESALVQKYGYFPAYYVEHVYDQVIEDHPRRWGLPGAAEIHKAVRKAGPPETYRPQDSVKQIEPPEPDAEDFSDQIAEVLAEAAGNKEPDKTKGDSDERNHFERARIRLLVMKGNATAEEVFWLHCIDNHDGNWKAAVAADAAAGKQADSFETSGEVS